MEGRSSGRCHVCSEPVVLFSLVEGKVIITVECKDCGSETNFFLDDALEALGRTKKNYS